jgi:uncharacterized protein (TIGR02996 family)
VIDPIDELLQAVFLAPADNNARLVLADHLMDRGDPRGELIQIQCTMGSASGDKHVELEARERELLALRTPPYGTTVSYSRGLCDVATVLATWASAATQFLDGELVIHHLLLTGCAGNWGPIGRLLATLAPKLRSIEIQGVTLHWSDRARPGTGGHHVVEPTDQRPLLTAMLEAAPRPRYFVDLQVPEGTTIPSHWHAGID